MSAQMLAVLAVAVVVAAFVQGSSGLGFALIVAPVAGFIDPGLVPVFVLASMIPLNLYVAWRERTSLDLRGAGWITGARLAATPAGLALLWLIPEHSLGLFVGVATVLAAVVSLAAPTFAPGRAAYVGAGAVTGLTETATGVGGPPLALVYQHRPPAELRSTVAACFLVGEVASLLLLFATGKAAPTELGRAALLLPAIALGAWLSRLVHHRLDARRMRLFVLVFALVSGVVLMLGG
ncbi:sulfite exporter TauE/SafE family protein [Streptomyces sp. KPB2]|uniref:sulfite exporter TauE/SafE family protein n=1 Tax=unclassified Streptomyces TaxID=2593676 RepID=UPI000F6E34AC|nr:MULTISPECIES: sulfite exporter TauE/SafE family protein [unclassified Streptomyces]WST99884.1 sulfite exporter TauE/SafE family protein [Streptomyces sp. NBC_01124]AZM74196.1 sulfite exporter TauE/SafE family protein [Streptomyces sp. KPB2]MBH5130551.1 sulfite exporter TauE/SafE family protein [Streptomyces sp. HB-N217]MDU0257680.1 sulfite exporter TauE/SafE family protein [Streptomyces sp. PU10]QKW59688.1 sulfite exporter TauE/SafE family protein [Streptomyces sp. NA03103]